MKSFLTYILFILMTLSITAQSEFHVFPTNDIKNPGSESGIGSIDSPWDLQTALSNKQLKIKSGAIIYLHKGVYNGRYISNLNSSGKKITVSTYKNDKVILNGNVASKKTAVLEVNGANVIFKNFEITFLGEFIRLETNPDFKSAFGVNHLKGMHCEFLNLKIHNNPGVGFGSWNKTGGSTIKNCLIFNNGFQGEKRGRGVGIYVQNSSDFIKTIENNYIFNNWYKGVEVWSANKKADYEYVKNITLKNNVFFNNGITSGKHFDNLIIGTDDRNSINIARNINVENNVLYHNTNVAKNQINGDAPCLTLGFNVKAPVKNLIVLNNVIVGRNNALRILHAQSLAFHKNIVYSGYVHLDKPYNKFQKKWNFNNNNYYTKREKAFRFNSNSNVFNLKIWNENITNDKNSTWSHIRGFDLKKILNITKLNKANTFRVSLFNKNEEDIIVDFSKYKIKEGSAYTIRNIEDDSIIKSGTTTQSIKVKFPMDNYNQTVDNFGVYSIEFTEKTKEKKKNFFKRIFGWLF